MACDAKCQEEAAERRRIGPWSTPERKALVLRCRQHTATAEDLIAYADIELSDALDNVDPIEGGSAFHAGCCMMRVQAALERVRRLTEKAHEGEKAQNDKHRLLCDQLRNALGRPDLRDDQLVYAVASMFVRLAEAERTLLNMKAVE